jgi:bleomycin hydrolase
MYTVYWEYVEKAKRFIKERGNSTFSEGSEANAVTREIKEYGIVPEAVYSGLEAGRKFHSHAKMFGELSKYILKMSEVRMPGMKMSSFLPSRIS